MEAVWQAVTGFLVRRGQLRPREQSCVAIITFEWLQEDNYFLKQTAVVPTQVK